MHKIIITGIVVTMNVTFPLVQTSVIEPTPSQIQAHGKLQITLAAYHVPRVFQVLFIGNPILLDTYHLFTDC